MGHLNNNINPGYFVFYSKPNKFYNPNIYTASELGPIYPDGSRNRYKWAYKEYSGSIVNIKKGPISASKNNEIVINTVIFNDDDNCG